MDVYEEKPTFIGKADDTNEFGVEVEVGALKQHMRVDTARLFAGEILAAADRAEQNDREESAERALRDGSIASDRLRPVYELDEAHTGPNLIVINHETTAGGGDAA